MKKLIAVCFCLSTFFIANSQVRIGVKAGLNLNHPIGGTKSSAPTILVYDPVLGIIPKPLTGKGTDRFELNTNFHAGFTADISITEKFHIRPDLLYSRRVAKYKEETTSNGNLHYLDQRFSADYLELPIHFVYYHRMKSVAFYAGGGPYVGLPLSGSATVNEFQRNDSGGGMGMGSGSRSYEEDWYSKTQFGAVLALGVDLPFGLNGELSVHRGFNDINKSKFASQLNKVINFNYGFSVAYLIGKKKS